MSVSTTWRDWSCGVRVTLATGDGADLVAATRVVQRLMEDVARSVSRFREDSDLSRVNAAAGTLVPVSSLTVSLVDVALEAARRTDGAVDPTVGAHLIAAGYNDDIEQARSRPQDSVQPPRSHADWSTVTLDRDLRRIGVPRCVRLDLGATAKAWAADEAARWVQASLGCGVLVGIGGDLAVAGISGRPWGIDVAEVSGGPTHRVDLTYGGLATSSVLARRWTSDRGAEHHVIDPATGLPVLGSVRTATVWARTATLANTWSTAAIVWGDTAVDRLRERSVDARLVHDDGTVVAIGTWPGDNEVAA